MKDFLRESFSYFGLFKRVSKAEKKYTPERVTYGTDKDQYFLCYLPENPVSPKVIFWVHGGGWNAGDPDFFDYVGQAIAAAGYRVISGGYRLSPDNKYPCQIEDVCRCYNAAISYLKEKGIDTTKVVVSGPSAGAHLTSILCYSAADQEKYGVDISDIIGFVGFGGPYSFNNSTLTLWLLLNQLFSRDYDRKAGEPVSLLSKNHIPALLIQSRHDGILNYSCAEEFAKKAEEVGNACEIYNVTDRHDTHSWYTAGCFLETRQENKGLDKFFSWIEQL